VNGKKQPRHKGTGPFGKEKDLRNHCLDRDSDLPELPRPPLDESQAERAPSTPRQLLELTESREGYAGDIRISIDSYKYNSTFPPSLAPRLPGMKKRKNMVLGAIS